MTSAAKILPLESLRGLAAISVALFHFRNGHHLENAFIENAWLMVDFFFVLSGFVIARAYGDRITDLPALARFQMRRFWRLYPLHLVMLLVFLAIEIAEYFAETQAGMVAHNPAFSRNNWGSFAQNLVLMQNWLNPRLTWNGASWSISAEFYVYAMFGLLALLRRRAVFVLAAMALVFGAGAVLAQVGFGVWNVSGPARCVYGFFLGVLGQTLLGRMPALGGKLTSSIPAGVMLAASVAGVVWIGGQRDSALLLILPLVFAGAVVVVAATAGDSWICRALSRRALVHLGTISYGIYMIHGAVWWVLKQTLKFAFNAPIQVDDLGRVSVQFGNAFLADLVIVFGLAVVIFLATLSYRHFETRFTR